MSRHKSWKLPRVEILQPFWVTCTTFPVKKFFLMSNLSLPCCNVWPLVISFATRGAVGFVTFSTTLQVTAGCSCSVSSLPSFCSPFSWRYQLLGSSPLPCPFLSPLKLRSPKLDPGAEKTGTATFLDLLATVFIKESSMQFALYTVRIKMVHTGKKKSLF